MIVDVFDVSRGKPRYTEVTHGSQLRFDTLTIFWSPGISSTEDLATGLFLSVNWPW